MEKTNLGIRMKRYEQISKYYLLEKTPVIIRIDGKAFHTFTRGFLKPFDFILMEAMHITAQELCKKIQGCKLGYTQSDEISLLLVDYDTLTTDPWFNNNLQKIASIAASIATAAFNRTYSELVRKNIDRMISGNETLQGDRISIQFLKENGFDNATKYLESVKKIYKNKEALFDARAFNIPKEEVCNYFIWRSQDCVRNSVQMVAQSNFPHKQLQGLDSNQLQEKLFQEKNINWNNLSTYKKRGVCVIKQKIHKPVIINNEQIICERSQWIIDKEIPIFSKDREYIDKYVFL